MPTELEELLHKTDTLTAKAQGAVLSAVRDIRKEILYLAQELDLARSADNREAVYAKVASLIGGLRRRLDDIFTYADESAIKLGSKYAQEDGELKTRIDRAGADAIIEAVRANGERNLAATMTNAMQGNIIDALRNATVSALREQALTGGTNRQLQELLLQKWTAVAKDPKNLQFVDRSGRTWDTQTYLNMNARTNATRIFNDSVVSTVAKDGKDLVMVSRGGDPECRKCFAWEGRILSITGKTNGFPTYDEAREAGLFHPNCTHTLETVDEDFDADEIELQRQFAPPEDLSDDTAMDDQRYEIDIARKMMQDGLDPTEARVAVDRDNLSNAIRQGLITDDAEKIVAGLSDEQITALCPNGNPPEFAPAKDADGNEGWNHGKNGGVLYIGDREHPITVERLVTVSDIGAGVPLEDFKPSVRVKTKAERDEEKAEEEKAARLSEVRERISGLKARTRNLRKRATEVREYADGIDLAGVLQSVYAHAERIGRDAAWVDENVVQIGQIGELEDERAAFSKKAADIVAEADALKEKLGEVKGDADEQEVQADGLEERLKESEAKVAEDEATVQGRDFTRRAKTIAHEAKAVIDALVKEEEAIKNERNEAATPIAELTQAQRGAVEWYVSGEGQWVNQYLRGRLDGGISSREKDLIAHIEKATDRELPKDITRLYRSVDLSAIMPNVTDLQFENIQSAIVYGNKDKFAAHGKEAVDKLIGKEFTENGFMSTTRDKDVALNWGDFTGAEKPIVIQLDNAKKARGIDIVGQKINEQGEKEDPQKEVLLSKGVKYRITGYTTEDGNIIFKCKIVD